MRRSRQQKCSVLFWQKAKSKSFSSRKSPKQKKSSTSRNQEGHNKKPSSYQNVKISTPKGGKKKKTSALTLPGERPAAETGTGRVDNRQISPEKRAGVTSCMAEEQPGKQVGEGEHGWLYNLVWWTGVSSGCYFWWLWSRGAFTGRQRNQLGSGIKPWQSWWWLETFRTRFSSLTVHIPIRESVQDRSLSPKQL